MSLWFTRDNLNNGGQKVAVIVCPSYAETVHQRVICRKLFCSSVVSAVVDYFTRALLKSRHPKGE